MSINDLMRDDGDYTPLTPEETKAIYTVGIVFAVILALGTLSIYLICK